MIDDKASPGPETEPGHGAMPLPSSGGEARYSDLPAYLEAFDKRAPGGYSLIMGIRHSRPSILRCTYDARWQLRYAEKNYVMRDPLLAWGLEHVGVMRWEDESIPDPHGIFVDARAFGLRYGLGMSQASGAQRSIAGFVRADRPFNAREARDLYALFSALHDERRPFRTFEDLAEFHAQFDVSQGEFESTAESFPVESRIRMGNASAGKWRVRSTPTVVVNGKWRISPRRGGGFEELLQVTDYLIEREREAAAAASATGQS